MRIQNLFLAGAAVAVLAFGASAAQAADYLPFGVQNNVSIGTVTGGGWSECFSQDYGSSGPSIGSILDGCSAGTKLMLAGRETGSNNLMVLAQADTADVTFNTGFGNTTHNANGVEWYFSDSYSWGFAPGGGAVFRQSCDTVDSTSFTGGGPTVDQRLCWHTGGGNMQGGWRVGAVDFLNSGTTGYEKVIYTFNGGAAPEPAAWALMIGGFGLAGAALRRRRSAAAAA